MNIVAARWLPYDLPLRASWESARGRCSQRAGQLLCLTTETGQQGWGDFSPLPEAGIFEAAAQGYALEAALLDLAAQAVGLPLWAWLSGGSNARLNPPSLAVNAVAGGLMSTPEPVAKLAELEALARQGFSIIKLKLGQSAVEDELSRLEWLVSRMPNTLQLRLDANGAWSAGEARMFLQAARDWPIEGLEEPLQHPSHAALADLQASVPFALAVDESVDQINAAFFSAPPVRRLILKPPRHGGVMATLRLGLRARAAGMECVLTSSLESACGLHLLGQLAAALAPTTVHGLATAGWYQRDTGQPPPLREGRLWLSSTPGNGFLPG